jgi:hypothetical protein
MSPQSTDMIKIFICHYFVFLAKVFPHRGALVANRPDIWFGVKLVEARYAGHLV